ncbi:hypothetical protein MWU59_00430 [Flavobacteriaceae bacterium F08102]|nr:hypothetical protein [Flavobacteriaceae bacterium F08102]
MTFLGKIKQGIFWKRAAFIIIPFFLFMVILGLMFNSFSAIIQFDMEAINEQNFSEGKWKYFLASKIFISAAYGIWLTARNTK